MTIPTFKDVFPHHWTAEILPNRPLILPSRQYVYPAAVEEVEQGALEILVRSANGETPFLATCALGFRDPAAPTGIWSMPNPDWICAVSGGYAYLIDTAQPERFTHVRYRPVLQVLPYPADGLQSLLLFVGHHSVLAWDKDGQAWESERLSWEGLTNLRIEDGALLGDGWDLPTDREVPFILDLSTGKRLSHLQQKTMDR